MKSSSEHADAEHDENRHGDMYNIERRLCYREHGKYSDED